MVLHPAHPKFSTVTTFAMFAIFAKFANIDPTLEHPTLRLCQVPCLGSISERAVPRHFPRSLRTGPGYRVPSGRGGGRAEGTPVLLLSTRAPLLQGRPTTVPQPSAGFHQLGIDLTNSG